MSSILPNIIPILIDHDHNEVPVGHLVYINGKFIFKFNNPISQNTFFNMCGGAGMKVEKYLVKHDEIYIQEAELIELSLLTKFAIEFYD